MIGPVVIPRRWRAQDVLTPREVQILAAVAEGKTNQAIAEQLVIAEDTVKSHVKKILRKLGAANRAQAVCAYCAATRPPLRT